MSNVFTIRSILNEKEYQVLDIHRDAPDMKENEGENPFRTAPNDSYEAVSRDSVPLQFSSLLNGNKTPSIG